MEIKRIKNNFYMSAGLNDKQALALTLLYYNDEILNSSLRELLNVNSPGQFSGHTLAKLKNQGYAESYFNIDRRTKTTSITQNGKDLVKKCFSLN